jgi:hypothetical protein
VRDPLHEAREKGEAGHRKARLEMLEEIGERGVTTAR